MLKELLNDENGQGMVEYAIILAFIVAIVVVSVRAFGTRLTTMWNNAMDTIGI